MKTKIGFDYDKVFVDYPPFIPSALIEKLYKKKNSHLSYRIPGKLEQTIRILSHNPAFRAPITTNINALKKIFKKKHVELYVVSSRFSFLKKRTENWNKKNKMDQFFKKMYFNFDDLQPHVFKEKIIRENKIEKFVDDDLDLLSYLSKRNPTIKFYWIMDSNFTGKLEKNITHIKTLEEFFNKHV